MIKIKFYLLENKICGFDLVGHALFANSGKDIVCSSVTSAIQLVTNGITEVIGCKTAIVNVLDNRITLDIKPGQVSKEISFMLDSLKLHLSILEESYPKNIKIITSEGIL